MFLIHFYESREDASDFYLKNKSEIDLKTDDDIEFEDDVLTLTNYSLITTNTTIEQFEMHQLVPFSTRK